MPDTTYTPFDADAGLILATQLPGQPGDFDTNRRSWSDLQPQPQPRPSPASPPTSPTVASPLWIHLDRTRPRAQQWLRNEAGLDPIVAESLLAEETRPRAQVIGDGLLVILRGVNLNPGAELDEMIAIRMWIEPHRIITLRQFRFKTTAHLRALAQQGRAPRTSGAFLAAVANGLAGNMNPTVTNLQEMLDEIEDEMLAHDTDFPSRRAQLATIRRQAITYRRYLVPQRDALASLVTSSSPLLTAHNQTELRVAMEQIARVAEALEELRDRAAVTQEEMRARHDARIGRTVYLLTIVATIALPLGILTGLLGINVGGIPLAESTWGFLSVCILLVTVAVGQLLLFKRMHWL